MNQSSTSNRNTIASRFESDWRQQIREYIAEREIAGERHEVPELYHKAIHRIARESGADIEEVQTYFFEEFQKTPEYKLLLHQGEVHG